MKKKPAKKPITKYVRNMWTRKPVTQVVPNKKKYDRKRDKRNFEE